MKDGEQGVVPFRGIFQILTIVTVKPMADVAGRMYTAIGLFCVNWLNSPNGTGQTGLTQNWYFTGLCKMK